MEKFRQESNSKEVSLQAKIADLENRIQKLTESINAFQSHQKSGEPEVRFDNKPTASEILTEQKNKLEKELQELQSPDQG